MINNGINLRKVKSGKNLKDFISTVYGKSPNRNKNNDIINSVSQSKR